MITVAFVAGCVVGVVAGMMRAGWMQARAKAYKGL
jgi:hypothetical protein